MQRRSAYQQLRQQFTAANLPAPHFEAKQLLGCVLGEAASEVLLSTQPLTAPQAEQLEKLAQQRIDGYPLQYLLGEWTFFGHSFWVGAGVLIPRQDTELLCETAISLLQERKQSGNTRPPRILDLCSGTGCIAITLARELPGSAVFALEKSPAAIGYLQNNIERHHSSVRLLQEDALSPTTSLTGTWNLIVCNPPYLSQADLQSLQREVSHEPSMALFGGTDGYDFYRALLPIWTKRLASGGFFLFEVGIGQHEVVTALMQEHGFRHLQTRRDLGGIERVVYGKLP